LHNEKSETAGLADELCFTGHTPEISILAVAIEFQRFDAAFGTEAALGIIAFMWHAGIIMLAHDLQDQPFTYMDDSTGEVVEDDQKINAD